MSSDKLRCFANNGSLLPFNPSAEIPRHASILVTRFPPTTSSFDLEEDVLGFYSGPTSIALLLWTLRDALPSSIEGISPVEWAKKYLEVSQSLLDQLPDGEQQKSIGPKFCGILCERLCFAVTSAIVQDDQSLLSPLFESSDEIIEAKEAMDEWVYGRAGYLYLLRLALSHFPTLSLKIGGITTKIIDAMLVHSPGTSDPWLFFGRYYFGAGHGWIGNIVQVLLSDPSRAKETRPWILDIIRQQCDTGNWQKYADIHKVDPGQPGQNGEELVQIGHGAPGMVCSLLSIRHLYEGDTELLEELDKAVDKAQECIWQRGLLTKESCLQHGAAGNSLALLDKRRKDTFLAVSTQEKVDEVNASGTVEASNSGSGLHRGLAGRIWAMAELQRGRSGMFLSYNEV